MSHSNNNQNEREGRPSLRAPSGVGTIGSGSPHSAGRSTSHKSTSPHPVSRPDSRSNRAASPNPPQPAGQREEPIQKPAVSPRPAVTSPSIQPPSRPHSPPHAPPGTSRSRSQSLATAGLRPGFQAMTSLTNAGGIPSVSGHGHDPWAGSSAAAGGGGAVFDDDDESIGEKEGSGSGSGDGGALGRGPASSGLGDMSNMVRPLTLVAGQPEWRVSASSCPSPPVIASRLSLEICTRSSRSRPRSSSRLNLPAPTHLLTRHGSTTLALVEDPTLATALPRTVQASLASEPRRASEEIEAGPAVGGTLSRSSAGEACPCLGAAPPETATAAGGAEGLVAAAAGVASRTRTSPPAWGTRSISTSTTRPAGRTSTSTTMSRRLRRRTSIRRLCLSLGRRRRLGSTRRSRTCTRPPCAPRASSGGSRSPTDRRASRARPALGASTQHGRPRSRMTRSSTTAIGS